MAQPPPAAEDFAEIREQLLQHNAAAHYMPDTYAADQQSYIHSGTNSGYITPDPNHLLEQHGSPFMTQYMSQYESSPVIGRDVYGHPMYYQQQGSERYTVPANQYPSPVPFQYTSSPPTPSASDLSSGGRRTRPNRSHTATSNTSPGSSAPRTKKPRPAKTEKAKTEKAKTEKAKTPKLDAPLSVLTKDSDVPLKDMHAWVHRSAEERHREVENRPKNRKNAITRPMNSFMLYRSAYADRTKRWCTQNNHQVVSSVSGESWPMESKEIRDLYTEYANIERENHQKAHPGYKFSPTKPGSAGRKRKNASEDEEEESDLEALDGEYMPTSRNRSRRPRQATPDQNWSAGYHSHYGYQASAGPSNAGLQRSSYQYNNPNKPLPAPMLDNGPYGQYYQTVVQPRGTHTEDVLFQKTTIPSGTSYSTAQALSSVPGGRHHELLDDTFADTPASLELPEFESTLDPSLANGYGGIDNVFSDQQATEEDPMLADLQTYSYPSTASRNGAVDTWKGLSDGTNYNLTDDDIAQFLSEANGNS